MKPYILIIAKAFVLLLLFVNFSFAQTPPVKRINTQSGPVINNKVKTDTTPPKKFRLPVNVVADILADNFSLLQFANLLQSDPDCKGPGCMYWEFAKSKMHDIGKESISKNWKEMVMWRRIPAGTVYGRWEISTLPFPPGVDPGFSGIISQGIIETKGADSVYFQLNYTDASNMQSRRQENVEIKNAAAVRITKPTAVNAQNGRGGTRPGKTNFVFDKSVLAKFQLNDHGERKFYIRIVPLNANKNALQKISNDIAVQESFSEWKPPPPQEYLANDYAITAIKYVPVHQPEYQFANCTVIASYNNPPKPNDQNLNPWALKDNDIFGLSKENFDANFQKAFPVGTVLCPQPPKEKAWYEKAFDGVTGFLKKSVDGAAGFYNNTKQYLKEKFKEYNCKADGSIAVINPTTKLQEAAGAEVCEALSGAAFDYGMAVVGLPPSLPNTADLTKMAEGQIVDLACDKLEAETGLPVPDEAREAIRKQFHDNLEKETGKGYIGYGAFNVKPDPRGQFQTAYLIVEVTRVAKVCSKKDIVSFNVSDETTRLLSSWNIKENKTENRNIKCNMFEATSSAVPYLENVGDKTTVYIVLKPQESYTQIDKNTHVITGVSRSPQLGEWYTPPTPTYEGYTHTSGFQALSNGGSTTTFSLALKKADGVLPVYLNK
jgi:hypothetical protein